MAKEFVLHIHKQVNRKMKRFAWDVRRELGHWSLREIARRLDINPKYVHEYLTDGIEPPDSTETGKFARRQMFLREHKPKPRVKREPKPEEWPGQTRVRKTIRQMKRETADAVVRRKG
jgi:hypothetical protein